MLGVYSGGLVVSTGLGARVKEVGSFYILVFEFKDLFFQTIDYLFIVSEFSLFLIEQLF